jgi:hypothetical protein
MIMAVPPMIMQTSVEPFTVNWYEAIKTFYDSVDIQNVDRILIKLQPPQQMMGQQQGGMMPGMGGGQNANEMQALAQVMYGEGGALQQGLGAGIGAQMMPQQQTGGAE